MYFEFDDVRRIHMPYTDGYLKGMYTKSMNNVVFMKYSPNLEDSIV